MGAGDDFYIVMGSCVQGVMGVEGRGLRPCPRPRVDPVNAYFPQEDGDKGEEEGEKEKLSVSEHFVSLGGLADYSG